MIILKFIQLEGISINLTRYFLNYIVNYLNSWTEAKVIEYNVQ